MKHEFLLKPSKSGAPVLKWTLSDQKEASDNVSGKIARVSPFLLVRRSALDFTFITGYISSGSQKIHGPRYRFEPRIQARNALTQAGCPLAMSILLTGRGITGGRIVSTSPAVGSRSEAR